MATVMGPNGNAFNQTRVICKQCSAGMVCDRAGLNHTQIVPEVGYYPKLNTDPETLEMIKCITTGL